MDDTTGGAASGDEVGPPAPLRRRSWKRPALVLAILVVAGVLATRFIGAIAWDEVWQALGLLEAWQVPVLLAALMLRQTLNALPLALFIPGLGVVRALRNDLTAHLVVVVAPPPGDMVMRVAMFRSWGIDAASGLAGATMNMLVFYVNRFLAPLLGLLVLVVLGEGTQRTAAVAASVLVALVLATGTTLLVRSDATAATLGHRAGSVVRRVRPSVDPQAWSDAAARFQGHVAGEYARGFPRSLVGLLLMVVVDGSILLLCLRFVGVGAAELASYEVIGIFLVAYPLTLPPLMGLGVLDLVLLGAFTDIGGVQLEADVIAALTVWRAVTLLGPVLLGAVTTVHWRAEQRRTA